MSAAVLLQDLSDHACSVVRWLATNPEQRRLLPIGLTTCTAMAEGRDWLADSSGSYRSVYRAFKELSRAGLIIGSDYGYRLTFAAREALSSDETVRALRVDFKLVRARPDRVLLVGQAPGRTMRPGWPALFGGETGTRLSRLAGYGTWAGVVRATERVNLLDHYPGAAGGGDAFPRDKAHAAARALIPRLRGRRVLVLGRNVATALGLGALGWCEPAWVEVPHPPPARFRERHLGAAGSAKDYDQPVSGNRTLIAVVPHPSGRSRFWNDPERSRMAREFLRRAIGPRKEEQPS